MRFPFFAVIPAFVLLFFQAYGQPNGPNVQSEQAILHELAAEAPGAVEAFQRGTTAMEKRDYREAVRLYEEVVKQAPGFSPGFRHLGVSLARLGQMDQAIVQLEKAVKIERTPLNLITLARVLAFPAPGRMGTEAQQEAAFSLAKEASEQYRASDNPIYSVTTAELALALGKATEFRQATETLLQKYPDLMMTHYFHAVQLGIDKNWSGATAEIKKAEQMGLPAPAVQRFLDKVAAARKTPWRWARYTLLLVGAWACGLLLLFLLGKLFSRLTLRFIERADPNLPASGAETAMRRHYRRLIAAAGSYYYVSIPFVIFLVLAIAGSLIYEFVSSGHIPIKIVAVLAFGAIVTVFQMIRSLFIRVKAEEPGRSLGTEEAPGLWKLTRDVAENLGTRPLDEIRITPGTEMGVFERGSYRERRHDQGQRVLVMGLGLVPGFGQTPFSAVLAHEYGHLSHRDTAGGDVAQRVNQDMMKFAYAMVDGGPGGLVERRVPVPAVLSIPVSAHESWRHTFAGGTCRPCIGSDIRGQGL